MARTFVAASTQQLTQNTSPTGVPITLACRANLAAVATSPYLVTLGFGASSKWFAIHVDGSSNLRAEQDDGSAHGIATHGTTVSTSAWLNIVAVFTNDSSRSINYNNLTKVTDSTAVSAFVPTLTTVGSYRDGSIGSSNYVSGDLAEVAIWTAALDDAEQKAYMSGVSPLLIRPQSLWAYYPIFGLDSPEPDRWNSRRDLTVTNTPTKAVHPRTYYPARSMGAFTQVAAAYMLAADTGSYALTGAVALLRATRKIVADTGSYALTGVAASLHLLFTLIAEAGSYVLTGSSTILTYISIARRRVVGVFNMLRRITGTQ